MSSGFNPLSNSSELDSCDVVVVGAGAAGLMTCLELPQGLQILLLNRNLGRRSSSRWAQGGMAAAIGLGDSLDSHFQDTLDAGAGLCDEDAVKMFVAEAPESIKRLESLGMQFDRDFLGNLSTTLEAAHSFRRVLHVQDRTGRALTNVLLDQVEKRENLVHKRGVRVTQLWIENQRCKGVQVLDGSQLYWIQARAVVLATGGGGHLFANTTNPPQACGEGISLAWKAGAIIEDLEFVQFHPTALKLEGAPCFLLSEALRGEGAVLVDQFGNSPIPNLPGRDLASRDQVSKALVAAMKSKNVQSFGLDLSQIPVNKFETRFPHIINKCRELGLDPRKQFIPVAPAAHYWMGGVSTNLKAETTLLGLYAVGEVASTGLHGANRLASNSLMECIVFAKQMSDISLDITKSNENNRLNQIALSSDMKLHGDITSNSLMLSIQDLRQLCWTEAGVDRSPKGMQYAIKKIKNDQAEIGNQPLLNLVNMNALGNKYSLHDDARRDLNLLLDLQNRQIVTMLLFNACLFRTESRGGHYRNDYPRSLPYWSCHSRQRFGDEIFTRKVNK